MKQKCDSVEKNKISTLSKKINIIALNLYLTKLLKIYFQYFLRYFIAHRNNFKTINKLTPKIINNTFTGRLHSIKIINNIIRIDNNSNNIF